MGQSEPIDVVELESAMESTLISLKEPKNVNEETIEELESESLNIPH